MNDKVKNFMSWLILSSAITVTQPVQAKKLDVSTSISDTMDDTQNKVKEAIKSTKVMNEWKTTILWEEYDFSQFRNKVLKPLSHFEEKMKIQLDEEIIFKFWIVENMWTVAWMEQELKWALKKFDWNNYKRLVNTTSNAWAKWIFQIIDSTKNWINSIYKVEERFKTEYKTVKQKYKLTDEDMQILKSALYCWLVFHDLWRYWWKDATESDKFWMYNMWPRYIKVIQSWQQLNSETSWYIKKHEYVDRIAF